MINAYRYNPSEFTDKFTGAFYKVYTVLQCELQGKVFENALFPELLETGSLVLKEFREKALWLNNRVGAHYAALIVNNFRVIESITVENPGKKHGFQLINYLNVNNMEGGLLLNFEKSPLLKRKLFSNKKIIIN